MLTSSLGMTEMPISSPPKYKPLPAGEHTQRDVLERLKSAELAIAALNEQVEALQGHIKRNMKLVKEKPWYL